MDSTSEHPVILFDGVCVFCNFWARFVMRHDREQVFRMGYLQSDAGRSLLEASELPAGQMDSVVLIRDGQFYTRSDAVLRILSQLPAPWCWLRVFRLLPSVLRDAMYDLIGRWRYRLFGRYDTCSIVSERERWRFIE